MNVINGNDFINILMKSPGICPNCGKQLIFEDAAQLAKSHDIQENVVMCDGCNRVFEIDMVPGRMTLKKDVTDRYPQVQPKAAPKPASAPEVKPAPAPAPAPKPAPAPPSADKPKKKSGGFFSRLFGK